MLKYDIVSAPTNAARYFERYYRKLIIHRLSSLIPQSYNIGMERRAFFLLDAKYIKYTDEFGASS